MRHVLLGEQIQEKNIADVVCLTFLLNAKYIYMDVTAVEDEASSYVLQKTK